MRCWSPIVSVVVLTGVALAAQTPARPPMPRDAAVARQEPGDDSVQLSGRVLAADTKRPLRRATISLTTGNLQTARWTSTDDNGAWAFADVVAGAYTVTASRDGYVTMAYGQRGPYGAPASVTVVTGDTRDDLDIVLLRGGVITGAILDDVGEPVGGVFAQAHRVAFVDGVRQLIPVAAGLQSLTFGGLTDDRGEYRLFGLAPGTYYVSAAYGPSAPGRSDDRVGYATTYYPGVPSVASASAIRVVAGESSTAGFSIVRVPLVAIRGRVTNSFGEVVASNLNLVPVAPGHAIGARSSAATIDPGGAFTLRGVASGDYFLQVTTRGAGRAPEVATARVTVAGEDIHNLVVITAPTATAAGRLLIEDAPVGQGPAGFFIAAIAAGPGAMNAMGGPMSQGRSNAGGVFAVAGIVGPHVVRLRNPPPGVWLKSVSIDGRDVTDEPYDFQPGESVTIQVVVSGRMAGVAGSVQDEDGQPGSDCSVVVFATDARRWTPRTRFIAAAAPSGDGAFSIAGLPPGEYAVIAVPALEAGEEGDPERLSKWLSDSRRVTLTDTIVPRVALTIIK